MKVAFISDIHGNAAALDAVLEDIEQYGVDRIAVLGDICYRGPEPKRSLELIQGLHSDVIKGNADVWTVRGVLAGEVPPDKLEMMNRERDWIADKLSKEDLDYLNGLPEELELQLTASIKVHAFHATPDDLFEVVLPDASGETLSSKLMGRSGVSLYVYAHIHVPYVRFINGKCLVNIGSVGLPFDGVPKASYAIVEAEGDKFSVTIQRVPFDMEKVVQQYEKGGYPNFDMMSRVIREAVSPFK